MHAVISYADFQNYMNYNRGLGEIIPVFLIKPSVILASRHNYPIHSVFEYFHHRTGDEIIFFLPGYAQFPRLEIGRLLSPYSPYDDNAFAFSYHYDGRDEKVYYDQQAFNDFIDLLELRSNRFRYYGNTELLFVRYIQGEGHSLGDIDFNSMHRYDLSQLFFSSNNEHRGYRNVDRFLEHVLHEYRNFETEDKFIQNIDRIYRLYLNERH